MAHTLYKPHVIGPEGSVTTPDLLLDSTSVNWMDITFRLPIHRLIGHHCLQLGTASHLALPGYALVAGGGGTILAPVTLIYCREGPMELAEAVMGRAAVRCRALNRHATLRVECSMTSRDQRGRTIEAPIARPYHSSIATDQTSNSALGRCTAEIWLASVEPLAVEGGTVVKTTLRWSDEPTAAISHSTNLETLPTELQNREPGRYSVGPIGPVKSYI